MKTATERAQEINAERGPDAWLRLVEDAEHWSSWGIHTADQLDRHLIAAEYSDMFKDMNGIRPRWKCWDGVSTEDMRKELDDLFAQAERDAVRQQEEDEFRRANEDAAPQEREIIACRLPLAPVDNNGNRTWTF